MTPTSATRAIVEFSTRFDYRQIPPEVVQQGKLIILDTIGAMLAASDPQYPGSRIIIDFARALGGPPESSIIGRDFKVPTVSAALANGTLGYTCDIEPHSTHAVLHSPAAVVPTSLAIGERGHSDGKAYLASVILGVDVATRVSMALHPVFLYERTYHPSGVAGVFGTAAAAGVLLGLNAVQFENAYGLAATQAGGLLAFAADETENSRPFNPGAAARNGVTSALLASMGFGGPQGMFDAEAKYNMYIAFSKGGFPERLTDKLGEHFLIMDYCIKLYACCSFLHAGLDGLLDILSAERVATPDISEIVLHYPKSGAAMIDNNPLKSHCAQYILPVAAVNRRVMLGEVLQERSQDPAVARLVERTRVVYSEELDPFYPTEHPAIVEVALNDGRRYTRRVDWARGTPPNPISTEELEAKFVELATTVVSKRRAGQIIDAVYGLEGMQDVSELARLLQVRE